MACKYLLSLRRTASLLYIHYLPKKTPCTQKELLTGFCKYVTLAPCLGAKGENAMTLVQLVPVSSNRKTGPLPVSSSQSETCPPACESFYNCYAKFHHCRMHWDRLDAGETKNTHDWQGFCQAVRRMPKGQLWRCNEKGDLPGRGNHINLDDLTRLVQANKKRNGFTYTHKPVLAGSYTVTGNVKKGQKHTTKVSEATATENCAAIRYANENGFTINLSADSLTIADQKANLNIGPVCVTLPSDAGQGVKYTTPKGRKVVTCPAALERNKEKNVNCAMCGLCQRVDRSFLIGFPAHGTAKGRASDLAVK